MRLLMLVHGYPPAVGGVEHAVRDLAEGLVRDHGYAVTVLTTTGYTNANFRDRRLPSMPAGRAETLNGVKVRRFPVVTGLAPALRVAQKGARSLHLPGNDWLRTWYQGPIAPRMRAAVKEEAGRGVDVICAASFPLNHLFYAFLPGGPPVVLLGSIHTEDRWGYERRNLLSLTRKAVATVAHTEPERQWLIDRGAPPERVTVIPEGVPIPGPDVTRGEFRRREGIPEGSFLIAYVGQLASHKGIDVLLGAASRLLAQAPQAWLVAGGAPTPFTPTLQRSVAAMDPRVKRRVSLKVGLGEREKAALLRDADVFCSPSRYESFGITTLEAWRQSCPVVVGQSPATSWVVGDAGVTVPYGDQDALFDAIEGLRRDPDRRRVLAELGKTRLLERFALEGVVRDYASLFNNVAEWPDGEPHTDGAGSKRSREDS